MTIISPSILACNFLHLADEITAFDSAKDLWFHLDIMDGHYVPNLTFGHTILKDLHKITSHKLDAHLMVTNPQDYIKGLSTIGIHNFTFHWEAVKHHDKIVSEIKSNYASAGVSLNPSTPVELIPEYLLEQLDLILIMSVNPGFGGQSFISGVVSKIKQLDALKKKHGFKYQIQVDGGVTEKNAKMLIDAGANNLVAGSYIFNDPNKNYLAKVESLR